MDKDRYLAILSRARKLRRPRHEETIFAVGGRGFYENPTSDLLAFFLDPDQVHGLGDLVLSSFLNCMPDPKPSCGLERPPERERTTSSGKRIDIVLRGTDWAMAIEHKLGSSINNPLKDYEATIKEEGIGMRQLFVLLAPYEPNVREWTWVDHRSFFREIRYRLGEYLFNTGTSKWTLFLRDLIVNIENNLEQPMNNDNFDFVRQNFGDITNLTKQREDYLQMLLVKLRAASSETLSVPADSISVRQPKWEDGETFQVFPRIGRGDNVTFLLLPDGDFRVQFYVQNDKRRPEVNDEDFKGDGLFKSRGTEDKGKISLFMAVKDTSDLEVALDITKKALGLLSANTLP